jgi:hypothetical protein
LVPSVQNARKIKAANVEKELEKSDQALADIRAEVRKALGSSIEADAGPAIACNGLLAVEPQHAMTKQTTHGVYIEGSRAASNGLIVEGWRLSIYPSGQTSSKKWLAFVTPPPVALQAQKRAKRRVVEYQRKTAQYARDNTQPARVAWVCAACTFFNTSSARSCEICGQLASPSSSSCTQHLLDNLGWSVELVQALQQRELGPEDYELLLQLDETVPKRNVLSQVEVNALEESILEEDGQCMICMCETETGSSALVLACSHSFHTDCLKQWLCEGRDTCPVCNAKAMQQEPLKDSQGGILGHCAAECESDQPRQQIAAAVEAIVQELLDAAAVV